MKKFNDFLDFNFNLTDCFLKNKRGFYLSVAIVLLLFSIFTFIFNPIICLCFIIVSQAMWRILCEILYFIAPESKEYSKDKVL